MKEEDINLVFEDLCARITCGVKFHVDYDNNVTTLKNIGIADNTHYCNNVYSIAKDGVKPYLRPLTSMTKKEYDEYVKLAHYTGAGVLMLKHGEKSVWVPSLEKISWLNKHHFDYRGLIEKGLALVAPEDMYN